MAEAAVLEERVERNGTNGIAHLAVIDPKVTTSSPQVMNLDDLRVLAAQTVYTTFQPGSIGITTKRESLSHTYSLAPGLLITIPDEISREEDIYLETHDRKPTVLTDPSFSDKRFEGLREPLATLRHQIYKVLQGDLSPLRTNHTPSPLNPYF